MYIIYILYNELWKARKVNKVPLAVGSSGQMCLINRADLHYDVIYYFKPYALAFWSVLFDVSVLYIPFIWNSPLSRCAKI